MTNREAWKVRPVSLRLRSRWGRRLGEHEFASVTLTITDSGVAWDAEDVTFFAVTGRPGWLEIIDTRDRVIGRLRLKRQQRLRQADVRIEWPVTGLPI